MPPHQGDLDRLNRQFMSCLARKSCNLSLFLMFFIQVAVDLNTEALADIMTLGLVLLAMNKFIFL